MKKRRKMLRNVLAMSLICTLSLIGSSKISNANPSKNLENELNSVIQSYNGQNVVVEDGISLHLGESINYSDHPNWKLSNNNVLSIDDKGEIKAIGSGTVFMSQKIGEKVHVIEVYVPENTKKFYSFYSQPNRNYYKVFVDAGHGGKDSGAPGYGKNEAEINLEIAKKVEQKLKAKNIQVKMSRETDDVFVELGERARLANNYGADVFVSIHQNSADSTSASGIETYYHDKKEMYKPLASDIQTDIINQTGAKNRGVKSSNLAVLRESNMPSALVENGFVSNRDEYNKLVNQAYQDKLATGIADGVEKYLKDNVKINGEVANTIATGSVCNTDSLNVRSGYGTSYPVIGNLSRGNKVEIVESKNNWHKIKFNGAYGYVSGNYINIDEKGGINDIDGHWAKADIEKFIKLGYVNGYEDNTFRPENQITRAEFIKLVNRVFHLTEKSNISFKDINTKDWYYEDLRIAVKYGYINGYEDNTFRADNPITRQEAMKIITTLKNNKDSNLDKIYQYVDFREIDSWANEYVEGAIEAGYINGDENKLLKPKGNITRAESVTMLSRVEK
ncbi:MAG: N-acetylmuramoyl-L-alanine amidase [Paeniclostridium sordellii]|nr:N-acetylmuramoyl-L-alanine amidase [Paeniclostridium sordellii]